jgi:O-6-methylguanine DNA methyltransferase
VQTTEPASAITRTIAGPWGPLHLAATNRGIVAVESAVTDEGFMSEVAGRVHGPVVPEGDVLPDDPRRLHLDRAAAVIADLVAGRAPRGAVPPIDLEDRPDWDRRVLGEVRAVGWGETASYGEIARRIGAPRAARAVGGALGRNPISLLVPCHRVIAADGTIGGYGGDAWGSRESALERKRTLLRREGITVAVRDGER